MPNSLFSNIRRRAAPPLSQTQRRQTVRRLPAPLPAACIDALKGRSVAVVGGGFAGLMAARTLGQHGVKVTVFEARAQLGGRVLSSTAFSRGRITELGAELVGSIHTRWCALAIEYGLALISRMDSGLYDGQRLNVKMTLDKPLSMAEIAALDKDMEARVLRPIAKLASNIINPERPWNEAWLKPYDGMSVADQLQKPVSGKGYGQGYGVDKKERLWQALELLLVNNNVARLEDLNFLGLLCLVRGGQFDPIGDPLMGYWDELEIYRCADGCQTLAIKLAEDIEKRYGGKVHRRRAVTHIDLSKGAGLISKIVRRDGKLEDRMPFPEKFDDVILAVPPTVWGDIVITPLHPKEPGQVGLMNTGKAIKFFSDVKERFWIKDAAAPFGGSLMLGQVWEGTDNQTRVGKQGVVLSVFAGARSQTEKQFKDRLTDLYSKYPLNLRDTLMANWPRQPYIKTGYASPALGQIFTVGKRLSEPYGNHMFFAGEHTQMDHFGYMEGALRSGERAARLLMQHACKLPPDDEPVLVAGATRQREPGFA
jgi:monoamine oxidase